MDVTNRSVLDWLTDELRQNSVQPEDVTIERMQEALKKVGTSRSNATVSRDLMKRVDNGELTTCMALRSDGQRVRVWRAKVNHGKKPKSRPSGRRSAR